MHHPNTESPSNFAASAQLHFVIVPSVLWFDLMVPRGVRFVESRGILVLVVLFNNQSNSCLVFFPPITSTMQQAKDLFIQSELTAFHSFRISITDKMS